MEASPGRALFHPPDPHSRAPNYPTVTELTSADGYVSFANIRIVDVDRNGSPVRVPHLGRRRRLLDELGNHPFLDVKIEITHLSASGVRRLYNDIRLLSETNTLTTLLTIKGYRIDSCVFGGYNTVRKW